MEKSAIRRLLQFAADSGESKSNSTKSHRNREKSGYNGAYGAERLICYFSLLYMPPKDAMQHLSELDYLFIRDCPKLEARCTEGSGSEWDKISHIPIISIRSTEPDDASEP